jgi:NADPH:quinone reductase-like Zn-dependent oxidoreductase
MMLMNSIRRIRFHRFGDADVMQSDVVEPSGPDAGQILVAVRAASVNPVDYKIRTANIRRSRTTACPIRRGAMSPAPL